MITKKRLTRIEVSLTPRQAVLFSLRKYRQGKTVGEYVRWLNARPVSESPSMQVKRQVVSAIRAAMKGQDPARIQEAVCQAQMEVTFLIMLVNRVNTVAIDGKQTAWLRIGSFFTRLRSSHLRDQIGSEDLIADLSEAVTELFSIQLAVERIQARYFAGEPILFKDVGESLELPILFLRGYLKCLSEEMENEDTKEDSHPELVLDSDEFRNIVNDQASEKVIRICAEAKAEMLRHFGRGDAANAVLRPYVLANQ